MRIIGLTGGIGTGKSTVSRFLQEQGAVLLDADRVGHESYLPNTPAWNDLVETFGEEILQPSGEIDRRKLGETVFNDSAALAKLNSIVHPRMRALMEEKLKQMEAQGVRVAVLEAALLIEAQWASVVDEIWVTEAQEETVISRLRERNAWTEEQIRARMGAQLPSQERSAYAQVAINTNGTLDEVRRQVQTRWDERVAGKA